MTAVFVEWPVPPAVVAIECAVTLWYAAGVRAIQRNAERARVIDASRRWAFAASMLVLATALSGPVDDAADAIFAAHMVQHLLLVLAAAPLLIVAQPLVPLLWAIPRRQRQTLLAHWRRKRRVRAIAGVLLGPVSAVALHTAALWFWHFPAPYQAALRSETLHAVEHACLFGTALMFWWNVLPRAGGRRTFAASASLFATLLASGALGAVLSFARVPWYPAHATGAAAWGLTPLEDQQLAGVIMWVPMGFVYIGALLALWLPAIRAGDADRVTAGPPTASRGATVSAVEA